MEYSSKATQPRDQTLRTDPDRQHYRPVTNIMVRAKKPDGNFGPVDLAHLDKRSLQVWLASDCKRTANVVLVLLNHALEREEDGDDQDR